MSAASAFLSGIESSRASLQRSLASFGVGSFPAADRASKTRSNAFVGDFGGFWAPGDPEGGRERALRSASGGDYLRVLAHIPWLPPALDVVRGELAPALDLAAFVAGPAGPPGHAMASVVLADLQGLTLKGVAQYAEVLAGLQRAFVNTMSAFSKTLAPLMIQLWTGGEVLGEGSERRERGLHELGGDAVKAAAELARSSPLSHPPSKEEQAGPIRPTLPNQQLSQKPGEPLLAGPSGRAVGVGEPGGSGGEGCDAASFDLGRRGRRLLGEPRGLDALLQALVCTGDRGLVRAASLAAGGVAGVSLVCEYHEGVSGTAAAVIAPWHSLPYVFATAERAFTSVCHACEDSAALLEREPGVSSELVVWSRRTVAGLADSCAAWAKSQGKPAGRGPSPHFLVMSGLRVYGNEAQSRVPGLEVMSVVEAAACG